MKNNQNQSDHNSDFSLGTLLHSYHITFSTNLTKYTDVYQKTVLEVVHVVKDLEAARDTPQPINECLLLLPVQHGDYKNHPPPSSISSETRNYTCMAGSPLSWIETNKSLVYREWNDYYGPNPSLVNSTEIATTPCNLFNGVIDINNLQQLHNAFYF